ncbi:xanthine dehydrogenase family protein molybdopterin-binding subunit [Pseudonocardia acidicola]|uniref:Xanthine dehydrogenase family protein molybdopterin-binding subunit n=1 Tax=Pseudonocardia acidicola TaxID=2724939 RepID=A0ABX1SA97_9PSEU|nr:xanthine dehydrogenase family protein molybdopterin-binding subunit [Pseudonocardia acidicola]NMH97802.1 xanthine dehydrogenase family protein molybdopterin-binding subunit [Pseudonocardia acidicola]
MTIDEATGSLIGRAVKRTEDRRLLTGRGRFADDAAAIDALHCAILRSPHPHARIVRVDTSAARRLPGVVLAISGAEASEHWNRLPAAMDLMDMKLPSVYALATDKVHYEGEAVAAVVAETRYAAEDALAAIEVEYEPLPVLASVHDALGVDPFENPDGPWQPKTVLYEEWGHNVQCDWAFEIGDPDAVFATADHVVSCRPAAHRYSGVPLETRAVVAEYDAGRQSLKVRMSTQFPHQARTLIAAVLGLPEPSVQVVADDVGGGFGNKLQVDSEVIPTLLAVLTGRPVKWFEPRRDWLSSAPHSRDYAHHIQGAFDSDGRLLAVREHLVGDEGCDGAGRSAGLGALLVGGTYAPGPYDVRSYRTRVQAVVTNKAPYGAYRGYGKETANLAIERLMDTAAARIGIDPVEIRRRNLVREFPYEMSSGPILESGSFAECLEAVTEAMDLPALRRRQEEARAQGRHLGIGVISFLEPSAAAIPMSVFNGYESASVRITPDGQAMVLTGMQAIGQGVETALAQITADRLGMNTDDVRVVYGDTNAVPYGLGAFASRGATYGMSATHEAATQVREKLLKASANLLEANPDDLELGGGEVWVAGVPTKRITIADVAKAVYLFPGPYATLPGEPNPTLEGNYVWTNPNVSWAPDEHGRVRLYPAHGSGAQAALVEVDIETGQVSIEKLWVAHDVGKMINPGIVHAQIIGGMMQGLGGTMFEQLCYDDEGRLLTTTLNDYQLPNAMSAPPIEILHLETPSPVTPLGTKGVGEAGCIGTPSVLLSAVEDALRPLGVRVERTPLDPQRVRALVREAQNRVDGP